MQQKYPFSKAPLPYDYVALMPYCDADTLYIHHNKIYAAYVEALNRLLADYPAYQDWTLEELANGSMQIPAADARNIRFCAGAVHSHLLYFHMLTGKQKMPMGKLAGRIVELYGSMEGFQDLVKQAAAQIHGVGWVWLVSEHDDTLHIVITPNNEVPQARIYGCIFALDMWEHAYFLRYPAEREKYVDNWFRVLDWEKAEQNYINAFQAPGHTGW